MTPLLLNGAFISLQMKEADYKKVEGILPTPSHINRLHSRYETYKVITFKIEHILHTPHQYQWLNDIKVIWKRNLLISFEYVDEVYIRDTTISTGAIYSLQELSKVFKSEFIRYPKPYYPATKKELYRKLVWFAMRVNKKGLMYKEILYATALKMNSHLEDKYNQKELFKKAVSAYEYTKSRQNIKSKDEIAKIKKENGQKRGEQISKEYQERVRKVKEMIPYHLKANGRPNITSISREMNISRVTISKILKMTLFIFWIKYSLLLLDFGTIPVEHYRGDTIIPGATFTLFSNHDKKGVLKGCKNPKV